MPQPDNPEEIDQVANLLGMKPVLGKPGWYHVEWTEKYETEPFLKEQEFMKKWRESIQ